MQSSLVLLEKGVCCDQLRKKKRGRQGRKGKITQLNAEFQGISRKEKRAFLNEQCTEIEENNRMRKTSNLFKKIRDTKGTLHAKAGSIKDRNGMDLTSRRY